MHAHLFNASVYYYFYERSRGIILNFREGPKALNTLESMLTGLIAGAWNMHLSEPDCGC